MKILHLGIAFVALWSVTSLNLVAQEAIPNANALKVKILGEGWIVFKGKEMLIDEFGYLMLRLGNYHPDNRVALSATPHATLDDVKAVVKCCADARLTNIAMSYENGASFLIDTNWLETPAASDEIVVRVLPDKRVFPQSRKEMPLDEFITHVKESLKIKPDLSLLLYADGDLPEADFKLAYLRCKAAGVPTVRMPVGGYSVIRH